MYFCSDNEQGKIPSDGITVRGVCKRRIDCGGITRSPLEADFWTDMGAVNSSRASWRLS
jgi:hypothetical protein